MRLKQNGWHFPDNIFKCIFKFLNKWKFWILSDILFEMCFQRSERWYLLRLLLPSAHSGRRVLPSVCPSVSTTSTSVHPALVTTLQPKIFNGSCSYLVQPLTLVGAWTLLITDFYVNFLGSSGTLKYYECTDWLYSWTRSAEGSHPMDGILVLCHKTSSKWSIKTLHYIGAAGIDLGMGSASKCNVSLAEPIPRLIPVQLLLC